MTITIVTYVLGGLILTTILGIWKLVKDGVSGVLREMKAINTTLTRLEPQIAGLLSDVASQGRHARELRDRIIVVETMFEHGVERRVGPPDRRKGPNDE